MKKLRAVRLCLLLALAVVPAAATAGTVNVMVNGPHGLYRVYLYDERSSTYAVAGREGYMQYGCGCNNFQFSVPSGHAYWAKAVRTADGMTRLGGGSVYLWWYNLSIRLPGISFPYNTAYSKSQPMALSTSDSTREIPTPAEAAKVSKNPTWGALKVRYR